MSWGDVPRVLVTRASEDASPFAKALADSGYQPVLVPLLERVWQLDATLQTSTDVPNPDWVVVTSAATVRVIAAAAPTAWNKARWACVGPGTAAVAQAMGFPPPLVPKRNLASSLVSELGNLTGKTIVHPRADLAGSRTADMLRAAGAVVHDPVAYINRTPSDAAQHLLHELPVDATPLLSGSAAMRVAEASNGGFERLGRVIAIGPSTAAAAQAAGLKVHDIAAPHNMNGLLAVLNRVLPLY